MEAPPPPTHRRPILAVGMEDARVLKGARTEKNLRYGEVKSHNPSLRWRPLCWRPKLSIIETDRSDWLGRPVRPVWACNPSRVRIMCLESYCNRIRRGTSSPVYKYKSCGRLRVSDHNRTKQLFSLLNLSNLSFSNLLAVLCSSLRRSRAS